MEQITGPLQGTSSVSVSYHSPLALPLSCCFEVHSPRKVFASGLAALLLIIGTQMNILLHYCDKCQWIQAVSHGYTFSSPNFHWPLLFWCYTVAPHCCMIKINLKSGTALLKSEVSWVSHHILQQLCLYCWCPWGSKLGDTSCNESLLNADIFGPGFGFGELINQVISYCKPPSHQRLLQVHKYLIEVSSRIERGGSLCSKVRKYLIMVI